MNASHCSKLFLEDYSEHYFIVFGDTTTIRDELIGLGGTFNRNLRSQRGGRHPGWILLNSKRDYVEALVDRSTGKDAHAMDRFPKLEAAVFSRLSISSPGKKGSSSGPTSFSPKGSKKQSGGSDKQCAAPLSNTFSHSSRSFSQDGEDNESPRQVSASLSTFSPKQHGGWKKHEKKQKGGYHHGDGDQEGGDDGKKAGEEGGGGDGTGRSKATGSAGYRMTK